MMNLRVPAWLTHTEPPRRFFLRYAAAVLIVVLAIGFRYLLNDQLRSAGFAISLGGMLAAAWVGGIGPALVAQTLILFAEALWFGTGRAPQSPTSLHGFVSLLAFYAVGLLVAGLSEAWRAARRRAVAERQETIAQREQLRATVECVGDGVIVTDLSGRIVLMNPLAESMTDRTSTEAIGKQVRDVVVMLSDHSQRAIENPVQQVLRNGRTLHESIRFIRTARNERLPVSYSSAPIRDADGNISGVVLVFRDETERYAADRQKDEFIATLGHELRNPLAPIAMGLELLKASSDDADANEEVRSMMERQTRHMVRLIDDLLDVSRITRGKLELRRSLVHLEDVVRSAVEAIRPAAEQAAHELVIMLPQKPIMLEADAGRLSQVLSNLLNNAVNYTPAGGRIELTASQSEREVEVSITDTGRGIPADMHQRIFEMFTQVPAGDQQVRSGLGIGLTLVKRLVELHGGTVSVESAGLNQGCRFTVRLPGIEAPRTAASNLPRNSQRLNPTSDVRHRVLVVDDNQDALKSLCMVVKALGHEIELGHDGLEAVTAAETFRPDIILMDIGMPRLDGYEAAKRIRTQDWGKGVLLVATSGWGQDEDRRRSKEAGFDRHLVKPVDISDLQELFANFKPRNSRGAQGVDHRFKPTSLEERDPPSAASEEPTSDALLAR